MPATFAPQPTAPSQPPGPRFWTREEFYRLADLGFFRGQRAERIEGQITVLSPQKWPHSCSADKTGEVLKAAFGTGYWVRTQLPLALGQSSDPEPDVSVVVGRREDYTDHPTSAVMIVEVADTSLSEDRNRKGSAYAAAGIPDYWIVNVIDRTLEVYRNPTPDPSRSSGWGYSSRTILQATDSIEPLARPGVPVLAADLLP